MEKRTAKIVIGTSIAAGTGLAIFALTRRARAAEGDAASAAVRAAKAQQSALVLERRLLEAQAQVNQSRIDASRAGVAARTAVDNANHAIGLANKAAADARALFLQAQGELSSTRKLALEREAKLRADQADALKLAADQARVAAGAAAQAVAAREDAERRAADVARQLDKEAQTQRERAIQETEHAVAQAGANTVNIECSRQAVASGFQELRTEVQRSNPKASAQQVVNTAAAAMRAAGVNLDTPNPALPFWKQSCDAVRIQVRGAINSYISAQRARTLPPPVVEPGKESAPPAPSVQSPLARRQKLAREAWDRAVSYAVHVSTLFGTPVTRAQALAFVTKPFQLGSCLRPSSVDEAGNLIPCAVPVPSALTESVPFWAQPEADVVLALNHAYAKAVQAVNVAHLHLALNAKGQLISVVAADLQRDPNGALIFRRGSDGKEWPVAKTTATVRDPDVPFPGTMSGALADFVDEYQHSYHPAFSQLVRPI